MAKPQNNLNKNKATNFAKYSGIAFQMLATIGVFSFIGYKIDENRANSKMVFTAILGLVGVVVSLISVIRSLNKEK